VATRLVELRRHRSALVASWATSVEELDRWASRREHPLAPTALETWHADPDVHAWILEEDGTPVAYGEVWHDDEEGEAELARLIVDPRRRRQGLGVALVRGLSSVAARAGFDDVWVRVVPENAAAIGCYRRAGFRRTSPEREEGFNQGQPRPYVWMRLEP
jgi:ribosomal protein S18 acetylase RimI-like enzyme